MIKLKNNILEVLISNKGAEVLSVSDESGHEFMHKADSLWSRTNPVLFPYCGNLKDFSFIYNGQIYEQNTQHGFARDMEFTLVENSNTTAKFLLKTTAETLKRYPFDFELYITYVLEENKLTTNFEVLNKADRELYFGLGTHPGFNISANDLTINDYYFEFNKSEDFNNLIVENKLVSGKLEFLQSSNIIDLSDSTFDNDSLMFKNLNSNQVILKSDKTSRKITVDFSGFKYLLLWSTPKNTNFVCIEPWYTTPDYFDASAKIEEKKSMLKLEAFESFNGSYSITYES